MNTVPFAAIVNPLNLILGVGAGLLVVAVLTGVNQSINLGNATAFWLLFVIGVTMCALGPLGQGASVGWWNPRHIAGYLLGAAALALGASVLFDFTLPFVNSPRAAVLVLGLLMVAKVVIALLYPRV